MENLPSIKQEKLKTKIDKQMPQIKENAKRIGKILGMGTIATASLLGSVFNPLFFIPYTVSMYTTMNNVLFRKQDDLMFYTMKDIFNKEIKIYQDPFRIDLLNKIKDLEPAQKAGVMVLQTLAGFQRYQKEFEIKKEKLPMEKFKKDSNILVYPQIFSTITHGVNIKTLKGLENLGYLNILEDENEQKKKLSLSKKIYKRYVLSKSNNLELIEKYFEGSKRSALMVEKAAFGNLTLKDIGNNIKDIFTGDIEGRNKRTKKLERIKFQLTDKDIDFEELYEMTNNPPESLSKEEKAALRRLEIIFSSKKGILKNSKIDIPKDKHGIYRIKYHTKSFVDRKEEEKVTEDCESEVRKLYGNQISLEEQAIDAKNIAEEMQKEAINQPSKETFEKEV